MREGVDVVQVSIGNIDYDRCLVLADYSLCVRLESVTHTVCCCLKSGRDFKTRMETEKLQFNMKSNKDC